MREPLDLTEEEREECVVAYTDEFKLSNGGAFAEAIYRGKLKKLGIDRDEADYLVRINRP